MGDSIAFCKLWMLTEPLAQLIAEKLPFTLDWLPKNVYLVGGAVRDALLKRHRDYLDLDFVVAEKAIEVAQKIARHYYCGFVVLDEQRNIARVVFEGGTVDFAQQEGESLEIDLKRRDFTINALAYHPHQQQLIDPLNGLKDLSEGVLKMVSAQNLAEDPLRLLRAYRQAAQLHFTIDPATRSTIQSLAKLVGKVTAERVQCELNYLLKNPDGIPWLKAAWQDHLLCTWLPKIKSENWEALAKIAPLYENLSLFFPLHSKPLDILFLCKLTLLLSGNSEEAQAELTHLKYSRNEIRTLSKVVSYLNYLREDKEKMTLKDDYFLFFDLKETFPIFALSALALGIAENKIKYLLNHYNNPEDPLAHPRPLLSGNDLMEQLNLKPSPLIGELLTEIQLAYIEKKINNCQEALYFAENYLRKGVK